MIIQKFHIEPSDMFVLHLPKDSKFLDISVENDDVMLWVLMDPEKKSQQEMKCFWITTPGKYIKQMELKKYIGHVRLSSGQELFVWEMVTTEEPTIEANTRT